MQIDLERRLDDLEYRMSAHGIGEGFCDCGEHVPIENVRLLMVGAHYSHTKASDTTEEDVIETWETVNRCKSEVHNPRPLGIRRPFLRAEKDALHIGFLGGRERIEKLIPELERLETAPPVEYSPLVEKKPELPEPTLPERIAADLLKPKKTPAELLLVPEDRAREQALELSYRWGVERPETVPAQPSPATIEPIGEQEISRDETTRKPVFAVHEPMSVSLRQLLERTKTLLV